MARYIVVLAILALAVGALFRGAETSGIRLLKMAGTIGVFLFGVAGSLALARWQTQGGRKRIEQALTGLGPEFIITDWAEGNGPRAAPDYLVVAPGGVATITVESVANTQKGGRVLEKAKERARREADWVREHLTGFGPTPPRLVPILVFTRRGIKPEESSPELPVVNPEGLAGALQELAVPLTLDETMRVRITRVLRREANAAR